MRRCFSCWTSGNEHLILDGMHPADARLRHSRTPRSSRRSGRGSCGSWRARTSRCGRWPRNRPERRLVEQPDRGGHHTFLRYTVARQIALDRPAHGRQRAGELLDPAELERVLTRSPGRWYKYADAGGVGPRRLQVPIWSAQIQTSVQAGGTARPRMRSSTWSSRTGRPFASSKENPRPRRRRVMPGADGSTRWGRGMERYPPSTASTNGDGCFSQGDAVTTTDVPVVSTDATQGA